MHKNAYCFLPWLSQLEGQKWQHIMVICIQQTKQNHVTNVCNSQAYFPLAKDLQKTASSQEFVRWVMRLYRGFVRKTQKFFRWSQEKHMPKHTRMQED